MWTGFRTGPAVPVPFATYAASNQGQVWGPYLTSNQGQSWGSAHTGGEAVSFPAPVPGYSAASPVFLSGASGQSVAVPAVSEHRLRSELMEEIRELSRARDENAQLCDELHRVEHEAARMEREVQCGRAQNERMLEEIIFSAYSARGNAASTANGSAPSSAREPSRGPQEDAIHRTGRSESILMVENLAAQLRAEMQCLWADGREVRALAARREMELRTQLSRTVAEEHAEARAARRVRDAAARKVAGVRKELDAAIREVATARNEQAAAKAVSAASGGSSHSLHRNFAQCRLEGVHDEVCDSSEDYIFSAELRSMEHAERRACADD